MDTPVDPAIVKALPKGSVLLSTTRHGKTNWATGLKVETEIDGHKKAYFVKVIDRDRANEMATGEFESQTAMRKFLPNHTATPLATGPLENDPTHAFYMAEFRDLQAIKPPPEQLASILAQLHQSSVSPTGKFGFPVTTFRGYHPVDNAWTDSWEEWFGRQFRRDLEFEQNVRGADPEMVELFEQFASKVIPRLLRPLQSGGRGIKPSLCHTDVWHENVHLDGETREPVLFDACCVYGHHEVELGMFYGGRYGWDERYIKAYTDLVEPSEPKEDFDDRVAIYAMRNYIVSAALWPHWAHLRDFVKGEMKRLLEKYTDGYGSVESA